MDRILITQWPKSLEKVVSANSQYRGSLQEIIFHGIGNVSEYFLVHCCHDCSGHRLNALPHIYIYMVFTVNKRKHFCSFQIALASVDNYMLIVTQHNTDRKTDSTANTTAILRTKRNTLAS